MPRCLLALAVLAAPVHAAVPEHAVMSLPGWSGALPSKHFSGTLDIASKATGEAGALHYWLIEAENNAAAAPIVLWLNGGPGSSSLIGLLTENGQLALNDKSLETAAYNQTGIPSLFYNPNSWSQSAHMLYLEQPKGVGFSFCTAAKAAAAAGASPHNSSSLCSNDDHSTAMDAHEFLLHFFERYPEHAARDFYITGESYAGTYIPMLMEQIDKAGLPPNFKVGRCCFCRRRRQWKQAAG